MAESPRIDELRKRIEKDPASRLFAQLAEELRKDGELEEAIRVAREGLRQHANYPSARMTLGRALLDTGDWAAARAEFELVLKGAPDNILASRFLAECLENLGERDAALARYKATLVMAPGEKHVLARIQELEKGPVPAPAVPPARIPGMVSPPGGLRPPTASAPAAPRPFVAPPPVPPAVESGMEPEAAPPAAPAPDVAPIPLVEADEEFELERPYESPATVVGVRREPAPPPAPASAPKPSAVPPPPPPAPAASPAPSASPVDEPEFELEAPHEVPSTAWKAAIRPLPPPEPEPEPVSTPGPPATATAPAPPRPEPEAPARESPPLSSPTLGELYFNQGFTDKAIEVYRELSARDPGNERLRSRLRELEAVQRTPAASAPSGPSGAARPAEPPPSAAAPAAAPADAAAERRQAIERTIGRLEGLLSAIRKG